MTAVIALAVAGVIMLGIAFFTGNTIVAFLVIALAVIGLLLLARDWRNERRRSNAESATAADDAAAQPKPGPDPETFEPDPWDDASADDDADADYPEVEDRPS